MPTISIYYDTRIMMYFFDTGKHYAPHIHAEYQDDEAVFSILDGEIISGSLPRKQMRLVQAWTELYQESLMVDWKLAISREEPLRIEPLR
jgi:hypothetical protein